MVCTSNIRQLQNEISHSNSITKFKLHNSILITRKLMLKKHEKRQETLGY